MPKKKLKGDPLVSYGFVGYILKSKKWKFALDGLDPFETLKNFRKSHSAEKKLKGDPSVSYGFVGYILKVKNESLHWTDLT